MKYLLDTNICIYFLKGQFNLIDKFNNVGIENFSISEITLAELIYGAENSLHPKKNTDIVDKFVDLVSILPVFNSIRLYGKEKAKLRKQGKLISDLDLFIGTTAVTNNLILVTRNTKEFERINDIKIENWIDN